MEEKNNKNSLVHINNDKKKHDKESETDKDIIDAQLVESKHQNEEKEEVKETRYVKDDSSKSNLSGIIIAIISIIILIALLFFGYRYMTTGTASYSSESAQEVIQKQENPNLKAEKLDPQKVYALKNTSDVLNNMDIAITKAQFRKDQTRLWLHLKNSGSQKIHMMPNVNSVLVDNNGHSYKVDSFSGSQITSVAPGTDEDVMLVFEPIRADAKSITYNLDSVFDMKKPAWNYSITVNLP